MADRQKTVERANAVIFRFVPKIIFWRHVAFLSRIYKGVFQEHAGLPGIACRYFVTYRVPRFRECHERFLFHRIVLVTNPAIKLELFRTLEEKGFEYVLFGLIMLLYSIFIY